KQILFKSVKCIGCGRCLRDCPSHAVFYDKKFGMITDMSKCTLCMKCVDNCYASARVIQGEDYTVEELMKILERDEAYYVRSGGGITFSGGEPLLFPDFVAECSDEIHKRGWTVVIETCGQVPLANMEKTADHVDIIYHDFKHADPEKHKALTGRDNTDIIRNIKWLDENFKGQLVLRYPYIPGCNDEPEAVEAFISFAEGLKSVSEIVFLPFHRLGLDKYNGLGRHYEMGDMESLKVKDLDFLKDYMKTHDIKITVQ
ncbi:MAG: glycyl-radical enzyme activating protein, partial [Lachnospiraceae bacterium]|nr:glycyl-radical enzyme activating protein [Lachnospiraceae bacterium]